MFESLKNVWKVSPWYVRLALVLVAVLALFAPRDYVQKILSGLARKRTDEKAKTLEDTLAKADVSTAVAEAHLKEVEVRREDLLKKVDGEDPLDFYNGKDRK